MKQGWIGLLAVLLLAAVLVAYKQISAASTGSTVSPTKSPERPMVLLFADPKEAESS